jgi:hypothetical protein
VNEKFIFTAEFNVDEKKLFKELEKRILKIDSKQLSKDLNPFVTVGKRNLIRNQLKQDVIQLLRVF